MKPDRELAIAPGEASSSVRTPPHSTEAEIGLLSAILTNNSAFHRVSSFLRPEHFYNPLHQRIFEAISSLIERGRVADYVTIAQHFQADAMLEEAGGRQYLGRLAAAVVTIINAPDYGRTILDDFMLRQVIEIGTEMVTAAYERQVDDGARALISDAERKLYELAEADRAEGQSEHHGDVAASVMAGIEAAMQQTGAPSGMSTGFGELDRRIGAFSDTDFVLLAGRASMGKTDFAVELALRAALAEPAVPTLIFTLEMSKAQWIQRELASLTGILVERQRMGDLEPNDFDRLYAASQTLKGLPIRVDDRGGHTVASMLHEARRCVRKFGVRRIVIDYLQLVKPGRRGTQINRTQEVSEISSGLKEMAKELRVPVIALAQVSRYVEARSDKRPGLADLRESGSLEADADTVMFVYRDEYYLEKAQPKRDSGEAIEKFNARLADWERQINDARGKMDIIIGKSRHGRGGVVRFIKDPIRQRYELAARPHEQEQMDL